MQNCTIILPDEIVEHIALFVPKKHAFMMALTCKRIYGILKKKREHRGESAWVTEISQTPSIKYMYSVFKGWTIYDYVSSILPEYYKLVVSKNHYYIDGKFNARYIIDKDTIAYNNDPVILTFIYMYNFNFEYYFKNIRKTNKTHYDFASYLCDMFSSAKVSDYEGIYKNMHMVCIACECESYDLVEYLYLHKIKIYGISWCLNNMIEISFCYGYPIASKWACDKIQHEQIELDPKPDKSSFSNKILKIAKYGHLEMVDYLIQLYGLDNIPDDIYNKSVDMWNSERNITINIFKIIDSHIEIHKRQNIKDLYCLAISKIWVEQFCWYTGTRKICVKLFNLLFECKIPFNILYINRYMDEYKISANELAEYNEFKTSINALLLEHEDLSVPWVCTPTLL